MKMDFRHGAGRRAILSLVAALAGGSTFTSCDSKIKSAVVGGLETTVLNLLDPALYLENLEESGNLSDP